MDFREFVTELIARRGAKKSLSHDNDLRDLLELSRKQDLDTRVDAIPEKGSVEDTDVPERATESPGLNDSEPAMDSAIFFPQAESGSAAEPFIHESASATDAEVTNVLASPGDTAVAASTEREALRPEAAVASESLQSETFSASIAEQTAAKPVATEVLRHSATESHSVDVTSGREFTGAAASPEAADQSIGFHVTPTPVILPPHLRASIEQAESSAVGDPALTMPPSAMTPGAAASELPQSESFLASVSRASQTETLDSAPVIASHSPGYAAEKTQPHFSESRRHKEESLPEAFTSPAASVESPSQSQQEPAVASQGDVSSTVPASPGELLQDTQEPAVASQQSQVMDALFAKIEESRPTESLDSSPQEVLSSGSARVEASVPDGTGNDTVKASEAELPEPLLSKLAIASEFRSHAGERAAPIQPESTLPDFAEVANPASSDFNVAVPQDRLIQSASYADVMPPSLFLTPSAQMIRRRSDNGDPASVVKSFRSNQEAVTPTSPASSTTIVPPELAEDFDSMIAYAEQQQPQISETRIISPGDILPELPDVDWTRIKSDSSQILNHVSNQFMQWNRR